MLTISCLPITSGVREKASFAILKAMVTFWPSLLKLSQFEIENYSLDNNSRSRTLKET